MGIPEAAGNTGEVSGELVDIRDSVARIGG